MTQEQERLLWNFLAWCREQGLALCRWDTYQSVSPTGWAPLAESGGTLIERFGAWLEQQEREQEQQDSS